MTAVTIAQITAVVLVFWTVFGVATARGIHGWFVTAERTGDRVQLAILRAEVQRTGMAYRELLVVIGIFWPVTVWLLLKSRLR